jgi:hypothetical protein
MTRTRLVPCAFVTTLSLCVLAAVRLPANALIPDPCQSTVSSASGVLLACPRGDGPTLADGGLTVSLAVRDAIGFPVPGIPATDIWLIGCNNLLALCGGSGAINASGPTDASGQTTVTDAFAAGGCDLGGVRVVVQGIVIGAGGCGQPCAPVKVKSPDIDSNLAVNVADFARFGAGYTSPPKTYNECLDFAVPFGTVDLADLVKFAVHFGHAC